MCVHIARQLCSVPFQIYYQLMGGNYVSKDKLTTVVWKLRDGVTKRHLAAGAGMTQCGKTILQTASPVYSQMAPELYERHGKTNCDACMKTALRVLAMDTDGCVHHWIIEAPDGPTSEGKCLKCGETRDFRNSDQGTGWAGMKREPNA